MKFTASLIMKQNTFSFLAQLAGFASNLTFNLVLPIWLGATLFGQLSIVTGLVYLVAGISMSGFTMSTLKYLSSFYPREKYGECRSYFSYLFKINLVISIILMFVIFFSSDFIAKSYNIVGASFAFKVVSPFMVVYTVLNLMSFAYSGILKNQYSLMIGVINSSGLIIFPLLFFIIGLGLNGIVGAVVLAYSVAALVMTIPIFSKFGKIFFGKKVKIDKHRINNDVFFFAILSLLPLFMLWGILLLLGFFAPIEEVAYFKISLAWVNSIGVLIPVSMTVVFSSLIGLQSQKEVDKLRHYLSKVYRYSFILIFPLMLGLFALSDVFLRFVYGTEFLPAAISIQILSASLLFQFVGNTLYAFYTALDKVKKLAGIYLISTVIGISLSFPLLYYFRYVGASVAFVLISFLNLAFLYFSARKSFKVDFLKPAARPLIASVIMAGFIFSIKNFVVSLITLILAILISFIFYFVVMFVIKGVSRDDFHMISYLRRGK